MTETLRQPRPGWGAASRFVTLGDGETAVAPEDHLAILDCIYRYAWACDELRVDWLAACFAEGAVWEGSMMGATPVPAVRGGAAIAKWLANFFPQMQDQRRHLLINPVVSRSGPAEKAIVHVNLIISGATGGAVSIRSTGFYRFEMIKDASLWRISRLFAGFDAPW